MRSDGTVWAWGLNDQGQLGNTTIPISATAYSMTPVQVQGLSTAVDVGAGLKYSLAVLSDGTTRAWGDNYYGYLGDGTTVDRSTPVQSQGLAGVTLVDGSPGGVMHSVALLADGSLWTWGHNIYGQLGWSGDCHSNDSGDFSTVPAPSNAPTGITFVSAGGGFTVAQRSDGTVWTWGTNTAGQLGTGLQDGCTSVPQQVQGLP